MRKVKKIILIILAIILLLFVYLNTYLVIRYDVLPFKYLIVYFLFFLVIPLIIIYFSIFGKPRRVLRNILLVLEILYIILLFLSFFYLNKTFNFIDDFTGGFDYETKNYYILVNSDSEYAKIKDLKDTKMGYTKSLDESIDKALDELDRKVKLENIEYHNLEELLNALENDLVESVIVVDSFYDILLEEDESIKDETKVLYEISIKEKAEEITKDVDVTKEVFNVYISGVDSYGHITEKNRSDVNIIMSINPKTKKILTVSIPRDYYVELDGINSLDKLTHAGLYGTDMSVKTIENLLDIDINYYIKVNFSALIGVVDALDGVSVYSNYDFNSASYHFNKGYNEVNGEKALEFVRTRKAFLYGDRVRGENQQAMIEAIIKKAMSPSILMKYDDILKSLEGSFTTNISTDKIMELVKMQLDKMVAWEMESISLDGSDAYDYTYTYPTQELYVMVPNEDTIKTAKESLSSLKN